MPSERRLHPLSFLFQVGGQLRQLVVPGLVVLVGAGSAGLDWQAWLTLLVFPYALVSFLRTLTFRYRFEPGELVISKGFLFRSQRHIPYGRIQNIDAVQNVLHRLFRVVEVRVETGGGEEPEAAMRVLPLAALDEMRERIFIGRQAAGTEPIEATPQPRATETLLALRPRELMLAGFIDSQGLVIVGAAFGLLWEFGLFDPTMDMVFGEDVSGRGLVRQLVGAVFGVGGLPLGRIAFAIGAFAAVLLAMRVLSMIWSLVRLYGFRLERSGDDLRAEYGLFTRVMTTIPLHRIQTLTIREGPLHRLFGTVSLRVDSAGSDAPGQSSRASRESLAPIVSRAKLHDLLANVLPGVDVAAASWQPVDPRGFRRALRASLVLATLGTMPFVAMLKWRVLILFAGLCALAAVDARLRIKHLGWSLIERAVLFRSGWMVRQTTVAWHTKIQVVTLSESPFDRRQHMASLRVDTAGAANLSHRVHIPYLSRDVANDLRARLAFEAARTSFRW